MSNLFTQGISPTLLILRVCAERFSDSTHLDSNKITSMDFASRLGTRTGVETVILAERDVEMDAFTPTLKVEKNNM